MMASLRPTYQKYGQKTRLRVKVLEIWSKYQKSEQKIKEGLESEKKEREKKETKKQE